MGSGSSKPSTPLTQNLVPPSEPATPPKASPQHPRRCMATPKVSHAEWDECMRQSALTLGTTTAAAIAIGLMVPAADIALLLGTGAGVLWSVKKCRTIMRDGILSPEEAKALENKKRADREEKRRQKKMEKEAKQKAAAEQKLRGKQKIVENKKSDSKDCCAKVKKALEQKGVNVDNLPCDKLSHKNEGPNFIEDKAVAIGNHSASDLMNQPQTLQESLSNLGATSKVSYTEGKEELNKIQRIEPEIQNTQKESSRSTQHSTTKEKRSDIDPYSTVKIFAPYSRYMSESVILTCGNEECACNSTEMECTCDPKQLLNEEPQQYILATDAENEDPPEQEDPDYLSVQQVNSVVEDMVDQGRNSEVQNLAESIDAEDSFDKDMLEQPMVEEGQAPAQELEQDEEGVQVTLSPAFESIEPLNDDSIELILEGTEDMDSRTAESTDTLDVEVMKHEIGGDQIQPSENEVEVVFAETHKSESWPFSFSLPSLDKFSKKKNNSFKWPPLTSSIIVKPKKEPTCKCSDDLGAKESENEHKNCTACGLSKNECTCPERNTLSTEH